MSGATERKNSLRGTAGETEPTQQEPEAPVTEDEPEEWVTHNDDGSVTVRLSKPLAPYHGKGADMFVCVEEIKIRELYAGDMIAIDGDGGDMAKITALAAELSKMPTKLIERLHWEDFARVHGVINTKLGKFLGTSAMQWRS